MFDHNHTDLSPAEVDPTVVAADRRLCPGLHVAPRALVLVLLLREDELRVGVLLALFLAQVERERADLLQRRDGDLVLQS